MKNLKTLFVLIFLLISYNTFLSQQEGNNALWLRFPAISPDGTEIVFSYMGDLYKVAVTGGKAERLTTNVAYDHDPIWSWNGELIAFASNRYGNDDVFVIDKDGGLPKELHIIQSMINQRVFHLTIGMYFLHLADSTQKNPLTITECRSSIQLT